MSETQRPNPRSERTRAALIAAGRRLFSERPVDAVTVDDIVQAAEVGRGSFYNHFADREALLRAISAEIRAVVERAVDGANAEVADPAARVVRAVCTYLRYALDDPERAGVLARVHSGHTSLNAPLNRGVVDDIAKGLAAGRFTLATSEAGVLYVLGVTQIAFLRVLGDPSLSGAVALAQQICALLLRGLGVPATEADLLAAQASDEVVRQGAYAVSQGLAPRTNQKRPRESGQDQEDFMRYRFGPDYPDVTYVPHDYPEQAVDLGEVVMNYATAGSATSPALVLIPGQTESWWGYEQAMKLLEADFQVFALDLRGQGRSSRTPGRYTLDNIAGDVVRFIQIVVGRPAYISGLSSGGVISAWLSAFAPPGLVKASVYEDPPLYASQTSPACGPSIRETIGPVFARYAKYLGPQWSVGDWEGFLADMAGATVNLAGPGRAPSPEPPQNLKEYDPEWGQAFWTGTVYAGCDHDIMLRQVKTPVLLTHHSRVVNEQTGRLMGALSDIQASRVRTHVEAAGQRFDYQSFPQMGHAMHAQDPALYARTVTEWIRGLD